MYAWKEEVGNLEKEDLFLSAWKSSEKTAYRIVENKLVFSLTFCSRHSMAFSLRPWHAGAGAGAGPSRRRLQPPGELCGPDDAGQCVGWIAPSWPDLPDLYPLWPICWVPGWVARLPVGHQGPGHGGCQASFFFIYIYNLFIYLYFFFWCCPVPLDTLEGPVGWSYPTGATDKFYL